MHHSSNGVATTSLQLTRCLQSSDRKILSRFYFFCAFSDVLSLVFPNSYGQIWIWDAIISCSSDVEVFYGRPITLIACMYWISRYEISTIFLEDTNVNAHPHSRLAACMTALSDIITVSTWSVMPKSTVLLNKRQHLPLVDAVQRCMQSVGWEHWRHVPAHFSSSFALEAFLMIRTWQRGFLMFCGSLHPPLLSPIPFHSRRSGFILGDSVRSRRWTNWVPSAPSRSPYSIQPSFSAFRIVWSHLARVWILGLGSHPSSLGRISERHRGAYWGLANYISCASPVGIVFYQIDFIQTARCLVFKGAY